MFFLILHVYVSFVAIAIRRAVASDVDNRKLVWGDSLIASPGQFPYFVQLDWTGCGGSLIAPDVVLTAAHYPCFPKNFPTTRQKIKKKLKKQKWWVIVNGTKRDKITADAEWRRVKEIVFYKYPGKKTKAIVPKYDIALLKLDQQYNHDGPQLKLNLDNKYPQLGEPLTVIGHGNGNFPNDDENFNDDEGTEIDDLAYGTTPYVYMNQECGSGKKLKKNVWGWNYKIDNWQICMDGCVKKWDVCPGYGDSGGPVISIGANSDTQVGIVSYGDFDGEKPDVLARVSWYCDFIKYVVCDKWQSLSNSDYLCRENACSNSQ